MRSTRFKTVPLNTTGGSYQHRSVPISSQQTYNLYPEVTPTGITPSALLRFPGWRLRSPNFASTPSKGLYFWNDLLYLVRDGNLYSLGESGSEALIGPVVGSSRIYKFADNGSTLVIATGGSLYTYDGTTLAVEPSVTWNPTYVQFLNERFITNGDDGGTYSSDVLSTNFDIANVFYTRSSPDTAVCPYVFNQIVYGFGSRTVEPWEESAGAPPYSRMNGAIEEKVGAASEFAITSSNQFIYFMGSDAIVYRMSSFVAEQVSNPVISTHFKSLDFSACNADSFIWDGHRFILFTFYNNDESWVYSETVSDWFQIGGPGGTRSLAFNLIPAWGANIYGADYTDGTIWTLEEDYIIHGTENMEYIRTIQCISGDDFGTPQSILEMSKLIINVETGGAVDPLLFPSTSAAYPDPVLMVECSFDGGYTFQSKPIYVGLGTLGDYTKPIEVHLMKQFRRAVFRLKVNDPIERFAIYSAAIDIRVVN